MGRFTGGWVKNHRNVLEKDIAENLILFALWNWLLLAANYKESQIIWGGQQKILLRGQLLFKIRELSDQWNCSVSSIHKWMKYLCDTGRIVNESRTHGTIITICNYDVYQGELDEARTPAEHGANTARTPAEHGANYSKEVKKERKKEGKKTNVGIRLDYPQEFNELWENYGRRGDKKESYKIYQELKLTLEEVPNLKTAIQNYLRENTEPKYRLHFQRFLKTDWREKLKPVHGKSADVFDFLREVK